MGEPGESLEDWLKALGKKHNYDYPKFLKFLQSQEINTVDDLKVLTEADIKETVKESGMGKPARRHFIDALKGVTTRGGVSKPTFVFPMSDSTWASFKSLSEKQKAAKEMEKLLRSQQEEIPKEVEKVRMQIQSEFKGIMEAVSARAKALEQELDREAKQLLVSREGEIKDITELLKRVEATLSECKDVMDNLDFEHITEGQEKIKKLCGEFEDFEIRKVSRLPALSFVNHDSRSLLSNISSGGAVQVERLEEGKVVQGLSPESKILTSETWKTVFEFFDAKPTALTLLWRGSRDGYGASAFHSACDGKGPTLTVVRSTSSAIFGGFNPDSWASSGTNTTSPRAWLFTLNNSQKIKLVCSGSYAAYNHPSYGPTFGNQHNLFLSNGCNSNNSSYAGSGGYYRRADGKTYDNNTLAGAYNFTVAEIETYRCEVKFPELKLDSNILSGESFATVKSFFDTPPKSLTLLWRGSRDGYTAAKFHSLCDGKGPTFTVVRSTTSAVFGGFNADSWNSNGAYSTSTACWLFTLYNSQKIKLVPVSASYGAYNASGYGPTWGGGHNLHVADNCNSTTGSYTNGSAGYYRRVDGGGYDNNTLAGASPFTVAEIETFQCEL